MRRLATMAAAVLIAVLLPVPAAHAAEPGDLRVMSWNMCGSQRTNWGCAPHGTPQNKVDEVKRRVADDLVQAALLQEICEDDLTLLMGQLGSGWSRTFQPYQWSQDGVRANNTCGYADRPDRIGTAIVARGGLADARAYPMTQPWTGQNRPFHCATATSSGVRLCTAHLARKGVNPDHPEWEYADDELREIQRIVAGFPAFVLGGDFNVQPPDAANRDRAWLWPAGFYSTGPGTPGYRECDQDGAVRNGRPTHDGGAYKIDYLFSTEAKRSCLVSDSAYSDHHVLIYGVTVA